MNVVAELKRRNVFKVAAAYSAVAWMFLELSALALNAFSAPVWVMKVVIFFAVAGFAVAVLLAWAFELTPEGIKRTSNLEATPALPAPRSGKWMMITISALALALMLVIVDAYVLEDAPAVAESTSMEVKVAEPEAAAWSETSSAVEERSLAILPFENLSSDPEQEYFSDGLTEELINTLAEVDRLLVTGRTSSFYFKDSPLPLEEIADMLGVANVLQGSVRKSGNELRIAVQLTAIDSGFTLWTATFDRQLDDIFAIQDEIAAEVTTALSITLGAGSFDRPGMTRNVEAYDEYLQSLSTSAYLDSIVHAERAVALDPDFALGWRRVAYAYSAAMLFLPTDQTAGYELKRAGAYARAVALVPEMPESDLDRVSELAQNHDYLAAERLLQQFSEEYDLDPAFNARYSLFMVWVGRYEDALRLGEKAKRLDPMLGGTARSGLNAGMDADVVRAELTRILVQAQGASIAAINSNVSALEMEQGNWEAALAATQFLESAKEVQSRMLQYLIDDKVQEGLAELRSLLADETLPLQVRQRHLPAFAALFGDPELALAFMESSVGVPNIDLGLDLFSEVRRHPGFKLWVEQQGLLNYWRTTGNWADYCRPVNDDFECF
jgi:TolB-like protein